MEFTTSVEVTTSSEVQKPVPAPRKPFKSKIVIDVQTDMFQALNQVKGRDKCGYDGLLFSISEIARLAIADWMERNEGITCRGWQERDEYKKVYGNISYKNKAQREREALARTPITPN